MNLAEIVLRNRSYRRFDQGVPVGEQTLRELVDLARQVPSASNLQPLRYAVCSNPELNASVFATLAWAAYLKDWPGPREGERPAAYIVMLTDEPEAAWVRADAGIAAQTILLGATERGFGGCMFANVRKVDLTAALGLPTTLSIVLVIALGKPVEKVVLEERPPGGSNEYYRTADGVHHVPKRSLEEVLVKTWK